MEKTISMKTMEKSEMLWITTMLLGKGYSHEDMRYCDDTYNATKEEKDKIGEYMTEYQDIGRNAFYEKYKEYKLY